MNEIVYVLKTRSGDRWKTNKNSVPPIPTIKVFIDANQWSGRPTIVGSIYVSQLIIISESLVYEWAFFQDPAS